MLSNEPHQSFSKHEYQIEINFLTDIKLFGCHAVGLITKTFLLD